MRSSPRSAVAAPVSDRSREEHGMRMGVIAISHTSGAGGETVGGLVSERLGYGYVDEEVVTTAAEKHGIEAELVADAERRKGLLARFVEGLGTGGWVGAAGGAFSFPDPGASVRSEDFRSLIREAIHEIASRGKVVIVSHGASFALVGRGDLLRVLVTAPPDVRARRLSEARAIG